MVLISKDKVLADARDAVMEVSGDSTPVTYGGDTGLAARIQGLSTGNIGYQAIFKIKDENYYAASCQQGGYITSPIEPTITTGSFLGWKINGNTVSFPYQPNGNVIINADIDIPVPVSIFPLELSENDFFGEGGLYITGSSTQILNLKEDDSYIATFIDKNGNSYSATSTAYTFIPEGTEESVVCVEFPSTKISYPNIDHIFDQMQAVDNYHMTSEMSPEPGGHFISLNLLTTLSDFFGNYFSKIIIDEANQQS